MILSKYRSLLSLAVVLTAYLLIRPFWVHAHQLWALLLIVTVATGALAWVHGQADVHPATEPLSVTRPSSPGQPLWGFWGLALLGLAFWQFRRGSMGGGAMFLLPAAWAWSKSSGPTEATLLPRWQALGLVVAVLAACGFRLFRAGQVPEGLITIDEPRLFLVTRLVLSGWRFGFADHLPVTTIADGALPFYLQALTMRLFGEDITGYRLASILSGIAMVPLVFALGR